MTTRSGPRRTWLVAAVALVAALLAPAATAQDPPTAPDDLLISEYVEGSGLNKALELFNGTDAPIELAGHDLVVSFNGGTSERTFDLVGTVAPGDVFVFADATLADRADQTTSAGLWNGDDAIVVRDPSGAVVDSFGTVGIDPGTQWGSGDTGTANNTLRRNPDVCRGDTVVDDPFDPADEYAGFGSDVLDDLGSHAVTCGQPPADPAVVINEFSASTAGPDVEYVELYGAPDADSSSLAVLEIEGDAAGGPGTVDEVVELGTTDADGFLLVDLPTNSLENGTITLLLVERFTGTLGDDLDTDDDGILDQAPWERVVDAVVVHDGGSGDLAYGEPALGPNYDGVSSFAPGGASRIPDGLDTDTAADWVRNDFDLAGIEGFTGTPVPGEALNTPGASNEAVAAAPGGACGDPVVPIGSVQGSGDATPLDADTVVEVEGVVVADFQEGGFDGYYVQDGGDGDDATSDGIFVYDPGGDPAVDGGDLVHVTGTASEFFELTQLTASSVDVCSSGNDLPGPVEVTLPLPDRSSLEPLEGMRVTLPQDLAILEYFNYDRFGEIVLATERQFQPTAVFPPGSPGAQALAAANAADRITLDDGRNVQNPDPAVHPNGDEFTLDNRFRGGDLVTGATGVLDYRFGLWRVQPTQGAEFTVANPRPGVPGVGGSMTVATLNVLNYFTTIDDGTNKCPDDEVNLEDLGCRGADTVEELERQEAKIVAALAAIDADVVGLVEIENNDEALSTLVEALNAEVGAGTYAAIDTGPIGTDAIKVAFIYQPSTVTPQGDHVILDATVDERFLDELNRPVLAQTFVEDASGAGVTVAVNHLKSKGSSCADVGDPEDPDGQGNCNGVRTEAAAALADWMAGDPTGTGVDDALIVGDLNAYDKEDPITTLADAGWTDLLQHEVGEFAYTYVFDGQLGYLDHALANPAVLDEIAGAAAWHANADEPDLIDYDTTFKRDAQDALYAPDPYRASDHDAVLVGLDLEPPDTTPPSLAVSVDPDVIRVPDHRYVEVTATIEVDDDRDDDVAVRLVRAESDEPDDGRGDGNTVDDLVVLSDNEFLVRAERSGPGDGRTYRFTWEAADDAGNTTTASATVEVPKAAAG